MAAMMSMISVAKTEVHPLLEQGTKQAVLLAEISIAFAKGCADALPGALKNLLDKIPIEAVAADYVVRRGAERTFQAMVEEILRDELSLLAADARVEVVYDRMLDAAMEPIVREVVVAAMHEARGAAARRREAEEPGVRLRRRAAATRGHVGCVASAA